MKIEEGPAFGALIIGIGVTYLVNQKTQNLTLALAVGLGVAIADYVLILLIRKFKGNS